MACVSPGGRTAYSIWNNERQSQRFHQTHDSCEQRLVTQIENGSCELVRGEGGGGVKAQEGKRIGNKRVRLMNFPPPPRLVSGPIVGMIDRRSCGITYMQQGCHGRCATSISSLTSPPLCRRTVCCRRIVETSGAAAPGCVATSPPAAVSVSSRAATESCRQNSGFAKCQCSPHSIAGRSREIVVSFLHFPPL